MSDERALIPTNERGKTSQPRDLLIRKWVTVLAEAYDFRLADSLPKIWILALADLSPEVIEAGFKRLLKTWRPDFGRKFPAPADLLAMIESTETLAKNSAAENAWHGLLAAIERQYHPDTGWRGPRLPVPIDHAARAANGVHYLSQCPEQELVWAKKRFVECYLRDEAIEQNAPLLPAAPDVQAAIAKLADQKAMPGTENKPLSGAFHRTAGA